MFRILLAVDGSPHALRAAQNLIESFPLYKTPPKIELLTVHLPVPHYPNMSLVVSEDMLQRYYQETCDARLKPIESLLEGAGASFSSAWLAGPVAETIVKHARETHCDCIYMGSRGSGAMAAMLLGSVVLKVLHISDVPVVVVP